MSGGTFLPVDNVFPLPPPFFLRPSTRRRASWARRTFFFRVCREYLSFLPLFEEENPFRVCVAG